MEADLKGAQRKIITALVAPLKLAHGDAGIPVRNGRSLPFSVAREWSAPAGHYIESWYLVRPDSREVLFEGPQKQVLIWGLQSLTEVKDVVSDSIRLQPGSYLIIFALNGVMGGEVEVDAVEAPREEAA